MWKTRKSGLFKGFWKDSRNNVNEDKRKDYVEDRDDNGGNYDELWLSSVDNSICGRSSQTSSLSSSSTAAATSTATPSSRRSGVEDSVGIGDDVGRGKVEMGGVRNASDEKDKNKEQLDSRMNNTVRSCQSIFDATDRNDIASIPEDAILLPNDTERERISRILSRTVARLRCITQQEMSHNQIAETTTSVTGKESNESRALVDGHDVGYGANVELSATSLVQGEQKVDECEEEIFSLIHMIEKHLQDKELLVNALRKEVQNMKNRSLFVGCAHAGSSVATGGGHAPYDTSDDERDDPWRPPPVNELSFVNAVIDITDPTLLGPCRIDDDDDDDDDDDGSPPNSTALREEVDELVNQNTAAFVRLLL